MAAVRAVVPRDGCAVETDRLRALIATFVTRWYATRPPIYDCYRPADAVNPISPYQYLAQESSVPADTIEKICRGKCAATIELRVADLIVTALEVECVLYDGTLPIIPNPRASRAAQRECCTGSTIAA